MGAALNHVFGFGLCSAGTSDIGIIRGALLYGSDEVSSTAKNKTFGVYRSKSPREAVRGGNMRPRTSLPSEQRPVV